MKFWVAVMFMEIAASTLKVLRGIVLLTGKIFTNGFLFVTDGDDMSVKADIIGLLDNATEESPEKIFGRNKKGRGNFI